MMKLNEIETLKYEVGEIYRDLRKYHRNIFIPKSNKKPTKALYKSYKCFYKELSKIDSCLCNYKEMFIMEDILNKHNMFKGFLEFADEIAEALETIQDDELC